MPDERRWTIDVCTGDGYEGGCGGANDGAGTPLPIECCGVHGRDSMEVVEVVPASEADRLRAEVEAYEKTISDLTLEADDWSRKYDQARAERDEARELLAAAGEPPDPDRAWAAVRDRNATIDRLLADRERLRAALREMPCNCIGNEGMGTILQCPRCAALADKGSEDA